jgi:hypothetical protein
MEPIKFAQANYNWGAPKGLEKEVGGMPAWKGLEQGTGLPVSISLWEVTDEDLERIKRDRRIYLRVYGEGHPVVSLSTSYPWGKTSMELILDERRAQITRGYSIETDRAIYKNQDLIRIAKCIRLQGSTEIWPSSWNTKWLDKFLGYPRSRQLIIAGALVLAQQDIDNLPVVSPTTAKELEIIISELDKLV